MKNQFTTNKQATIYAKLESAPVRFKVYDASGNLFYFRDLAEGQTEIKFNIPIPGTYKTNVPGDYEVKDIKITTLNYQLPEAEKNFMHDTFLFRYNPNLTGTPARNFYKRGVIEYGNEFLKWPYPIRLFILCHEIGHAYYHDEEKADAFAAKIYIENGYNASTALHALSDVLKFESKRNKKRLMNILKILSNE